MCEKEPIQVGFTKLGRQRCYEQLKARWIEEFGGEKKNKQKIMEFLRNKSNVTPQQFGEIATDISQRLDCLCALSEMVRKGEVIFDEDGCFYNLK